MQANALALHLYTPDGTLMQTVTGRLEGREEDVDVGEGRNKTLVWVKGIEGYEVPGDLPDQTVEKTEGWFPEHDVEKVREGLTAGLRRN
jgi:hypothetical protein